MSKQDKSANSIYYQDEILQMMYWMRGEGLGETPALAELNRFLNLEEETLRLNVRRLVEAGNLQYVNSEDGVQRVQLTERGIAEGKRRFVEEFEPYLGHESHLECDDPNCECHNPDWEGLCHNLIHAHEHA